MRLIGELQGWSPFVFNTESGGGGSPLDITWLVLVFDFWFGRRLAQNGSRPKSTMLAIVLSVVGVAVTRGMFMITFAIMGDPENLTSDQWQTAGISINVGAAIAGLLALVAWPRAWLTLVLYGILARIPVIIIQYYSVVKGWDVHFAKGAPGMPDDMVLYALTMAQCMLWPLSWTPLVGGLFAAIGAWTVKGGSK